MDEFDGTLISDTFAEPATRDGWSEWAADLSGVYGETARAVIADASVALAGIDGEIERRMDALQ